jgi:hypothetical protein
MFVRLGDRLLRHVTLALSCACLIQAEEYFLPQLQWALIPLSVLFLLSFFAEGRWILPAWGANLLGVAIAIGGGVWLWLTYQDSETDLEWVGSVLTGSFVPYSAPVVMALLLVMMFRPHSPSHFWIVQGLGLVQVCLGCALAFSLLFGTLLTAYLACALGCLALHHVCREQETAPPPLAGAPRPARAFALLRALFWMLRWTFVVGVTSVLLFLITPRGGGPIWNPRDSFDRNPTRARAQTGMSDQINLNRTGEVEVDDDVAFKVSATDENGKPKLDLPGDQRWRGVVLDHYADGVWTTLPSPGGPRPGLVTVPGYLPNFGAGQWFLTYGVEPHKAGGLFLADPVIGGVPNLPMPTPPVRVQAGKERQPSLSFDPYGAVLPVLFSERQEIHYTQVMAPRADPDRRRYFHSEGLLQQLTLQAPAGLEEWTRGLLRRLAADPAYQLGGIDLRPLGQGGRPLAMPHWERVSRALAVYLAHSGEYGYSLDLRRHDTTIDPVLDFLQNVKQGHCQRYATALVLMLRSQGIPARVVKGFRGAESQGDGNYIVRQSHAHAWVESLALSRSGGHEWLTLDPTPEGELPSPPRFSLSRWWKEGQRSGEWLWRELIIDYNAEHQANVFETLASGGERGAWLDAARGLSIAAAVLGGVGISLMILWHFRRFRSGTRPVVGTSFYARLVTLLTRHLHLEPQPSQTPCEYSDAAREVLRATAAADMADVPRRLVVLYYRVRYGGRPLSAEEGGAVEAELDQLAAALSGRNG